MYNCCIDKCNKPDSVPHHVFFGNGSRDLSETYNLKVPLCFEHHTGGNDSAHNKKIYYQWKFCIKMGISFHACNRAINNHKHSRAAKKYLGLVKNKLESFLEKYLTH